MRRRKFIICWMLCTLLCAAFRNEVVALDVKPATSFRSELWRMEFRAEEKEQAPDAVDSEGSRPLPKSPGGPKSADEIVIEGQLLPEPAAPGQTHLNDLNAETPFAEWQVDLAAQGEVNTMRRTPTAWTLSQAAGGRSANPAIVLASGPSVITFLVAIVAGIVMIGAFFSGRE